jgi:site-specific DNA recombinase
VLLEAHRELESAGIALRSATEPFDTSTSVGKLLFQLLGSFAEFEKNSMHERMTLGRDRVAKYGKWTGGPIPFGYDTDERGVLVPSARFVEATGQTEAELVQSLFERVAGGSTLVLEARRLNALGILSPRRWAGGKVEKIDAPWSTTRLSRMFVNPVYIGKSVLRSRHQVIERPVAALVDEELWNRAHRQVSVNRASSSRVDDRVFLLRGLVRCGNCGCTYMGSVGGRGGHGKKHVYYRCSSRVLRKERNLTVCEGRAISARFLEDVVWADCRQFILNPGETLAEAQRQVSERSGDIAQLVDEQQAIELMIETNRAEQERAKTLYVRGRTSLEETEARLDQLADEIERLTGRLAAARAQQAIADAFEAQVSDAELLLMQFREKLEAIERVDDLGAKRELVQLLVSAVRVDTEVVGSGRKDARITINYAFAPTAARDCTAGFSMGTPTTLPYSVHEPS